MLQERGVEELVVIVVVALLSSSIGSWLLPSIVSLAASEVECVDSLIFK